MSSSVVGRTFTLLRALSEPNRATKLLTSSVFSNRMALETAYLPQTQQCLYSKHHAPMDTNEGFVPVSPEWCSASLDSKTPANKTLTPSLSCSRKITSPAFKNIFTDELNDLNRIFSKHGHTLRIAGGAVRDILMDHVPHDIDFATDATPQEMIKMFTLEKIRMIEYGERAIAHGTVTVRINDKENYEVTTTRSDVTTDGRHATVEFHKDWRRDANRRDLTFNAMFLDLEGNLYDFFNGAEDLEAKRVQFVGDAQTRIREDYLRIMRYFRFYGRIAAAAEDHDKETLEVINRTCDGLAGVAGERIWVELKKILKGNFADHQIKHIIELGIGKHIGLQDVTLEDVDRFTEVYGKCKSSVITESALLASLFKHKQQVDALLQRLKVSRVEYHTMLHIVEHRADYRQGNVKYYQDMVVDSNERQQCLQRCLQLAAYMNDTSAYDALQSWKLPKFPFSAKLFVENGVDRKAIGSYLTQVKEHWKRSNFSASKEELEEFALKLLK